MIRDILSGFLGRVLFWLFLALAVHIIFNYAYAQLNNEPISVGSAIGKTIVADYNMVIDNTGKIYSDIIIEF